MVHFSISRTPLDVAGAEKARNSMIKILYHELFKQILVDVNRNISSATSKGYIGILDIAGHGN